MKNQKNKKSHRSPARRIILICLAVLIIAAVICAVILFVIPQIKISSYEASLSMEDSPTAEYADLMPDTGTVYSWAEDLVNLGARRQGTDAWAQAQEYVYNAFVSFGLSDVQILETTSSNYECTDYSLTINGRFYECYYMGFSGIGADYGDFENDVTAELVYVNYGEESDFNKIDVEGKIVVCDVYLTQVPIIGIRLVSNLFYDPDKTLSLWSSRTNPYGGDYMEAYELAMENGAVGFIGVLTNYIDSCTYNNEDLRYYTDYQADLPGLWVSNTTGDAIKEAIEEGAPATLTLSGSFTEVCAGAVIGYVYGQSNETIMVESHYDSLTEGAAEDASGCAVMMAIADYYSQIPSEDLDRTIMFVAMDTHFTDYDSHDAFIEAFIGDNSNIICNLAVEHIALEAEENEDGELVLTGEVEPRVIFVSDDADTLIQITTEEVIRHGYARTVIVPATVFGDEVPTDADLFYQEGIPIINLISGPIYLYDEADTVDKIAKDELVPTAELFSDILFRLLSLPIEDFS